MFYPRIKETKTNILKFELKSGEIADDPISGYTEVG